ncbi:cysteine--tRNA ligase [Thermithiobacillus tepidarius DSM 3134]|uniref:cysteine--tRNA ligase n=1 Tax=Thermithiobacillus tepidarius TaxID=929 RepID=UPI00042181E5|nr:cysteine--tRNA ligase [Thermithiobacillus tepidarius]
MLIYNTLTRRKEELVPIEPNHVRMYVCGMTVYDHCHLGHARVMITFDMVVRYLRASGLRVTYVRNITDIDDKIIRRAAENGEPIDALTDRFIAAMHEDERDLNVLLPDLEPRATYHVPGMIAMIQTLIEKGHAYAASNGDVYYAVRSFPGYGKLSGKSLEDLEAGARVEPGEAKRDPLDFALWKAAKPGEPAWDSPWGRGRPGWHIECSVMSIDALGCHFDIHGGGMDLQFPHHENEIAQSEGATGCHFANLWMHNGFVRVNEEKMSKSLGNFFTIRELLPRFGGEVVRFFILSSHYRSPLNYSDENLEIAKNGLTRLYTALKGVEAAHYVSFEEIPAQLSPWLTRFIAAMDDDFNTPEALAVLFELATELNRAKGVDESLAAELAGLLKRLGHTLGLLEQDPVAFLQGGAGAVLDVARIEALIAERAAAKKAKNYAEADRIRAMLSEEGIVLEDGAQGTTWRRG